MALTQISTQGIKDGTITGTDLATNVDLVDNQKLRLGTSQNLEIYNNSNTAFLAHTTGGIKLSVAGGSNQVQINKGVVDEHMAKFIADGAVELYHNNSKKLETTSTGIKTTGNVAANETIVQVLHANETQGVGTGFNGLHMIGSNTNVEMTLRSKGSGDIKLQSSANEDMAIFTPDGAVELYHNNSKKFETTSTGVDILGSDTTGSNLNGDLVINNAAGTRYAVFDASHTKLNFSDNALITLGTSNDLQIYHNGSHSYIDDAGTGNLYIRSSQLVLQNAAGDEDLAILTSNGAVKLYFDNSKKFETRSGGIGVFGHIEAGDNNKLMLGNSNDLQIFHDGGDSAIEIPSGAVGNLNLNMLNGSAGTFIRTNSSTMRNLTCRKNNSGADNVDYFQCRNSANGLKLQIQSTGDVKNANNSYGQVSDSKLKENIVDANSQWNDIKAIKVRNWNYKESTGLPTHKQIGVVAQELETVSAGLVEEQIDRDPDTGADLGTTTKGVKYSVLYMKAIKCLQEAIGKIEVLETEVAALKAS